MTSEKSEIHGRSELRERQTLRERNTHNLEGEAHTFRNTQTLKRDTQH